MANDTESENGYIESYIYLDEAGERILGYDEEDHIFKAHRDVFAANGIDIHRITRYSEFSETWCKFKDAVFEVVQARILSRPARTMEQKLVQAIYRADFDEADRLSALIKKRNALGLKRIK